MAKNLKLNIKNAQIAQAVDLGSLKTSLKANETSEAKDPEVRPPEVKAKEAKLKEAKPKGPAEPVVEKASKLEKAAKKEPSSASKLEKEKEETATSAPRVRARSKSVFSEPAITQAKGVAKESQEGSLRAAQKEAEREATLEIPRQKSSEELRKEIFGQDPTPTPPAPPAPPVELKAAPPPETNQVVSEKAPVIEAEAAIPAPPPAKPIHVEPEPRRAYPEKGFLAPLPERPVRPTAPMPPLPKKSGFEKLGPTGRHIKDLAPPPRRAPQAESPPPGNRPPFSRPPQNAGAGAAAAQRPRPKTQEGPPKELSTDAKKPLKPPLKGKEFRDVKPVRKPDTQGTRSFDARDRLGLRSGDEDRGWRRRRPKQQRYEEDLTIRPSSLHIRIPIAIKDLASEMKLKASQLIAKLFMQGVVMTLNDFLEDETTIQLLGHEFGCELTIDTSEEQRLRITNKTIKEEISQSEADEISTRAPIVAFMGHVDHGKTSLIDYIRKSNRAAGEAGAITQHIGAFKCHTAVGDIAILDTPGHEAFSAMRARGADVTDIVVLVVAGDEGIRQQTLEAIQHAKAAHVTLVIAINKCDKPNFDAEVVYRQLSENELLPEAWGGETITVNCSATTGEGVQSLLEMLALQAEVLELKANANARARGSVLESEMHKGMGSVATILVQNGTLRLGDALVFGQTWGRVKTMRNEFQQDLKEAGPSTPVEITGLSGLPEAGEEFIVVKTEREARDIAEGRMQGIKQSHLQMKKKLSVENLFQQATDGTTKKNLNIVLRADVQGSLEALKSALQKIESKKADLNVIFAGVGEISESDVQLAAASKAIVVGFHTQIESHADILVKQMGVQVRLHDIIYHAVDDVKLLLAGTLDKIPVETEKGKAEIKASFKSSQYGIIAGCQVIEGSIVRKFPIRLRRGDEIVWKGTISSLKRVKEDVSEVTKGLECGVVFNGTSNFNVGDIIESYEITYITQEL